MCKAGPCHRSGDGVNLSSVPEQFMWNLWWTKCHWDRYFPEYFSFLLSVIIPPMLHTHLSSPLSSKVDTMICRTEGPSLATLPHALKCRAQQPGFSPQLEQIFHHHVQTGFGTHPDSHSMATDTLSPGIILVLSVQPQQISGPAIVILSRYWGQFSSVNAAEVWS